MLRLRACRSATGWHAAVLSVICAAGAVGVAGPANAVVSVDVGMVGASASAPDAARWVWPIAGARIERPYAAPAHAYGPGHRGIDLLGGSGVAVRAPDSGVIAFSGAIAGRGIVTIDHGAGLVTTLEPVASELVAGTAVDGGQEVATLAAGGHTPAGALHLGVRLDGRYINPLVLLGGVPRAVLLPCC
ncbi:murein hydrolase activator EnvC family protein [Microbacterium sp. P03]|uniref:murein hydrolase activator EnvC family protein n=1 Tax=Microbacterium sp. P03 TaxID=3366946 RepID=UPI003745A461